jgi:putative ABC transport system substrate-binding protein
MKRRHVLVGLGAALASPPLAALAQTATPWHIGFLTPRTRPTPPDRDSFSDAFLEGMRALGYEEGRNLVIDWRYADGSTQRLAEFAAELARMDLAVIVAYGIAAAQALQRTQTRLPIVITAAADPVGSGLVASLARPGGNITGLSAINFDLTVKQLDLLKVLLPQLRRVAVLLNPGNGAHAGVFGNLQAAAPKYGVELVAVKADTPDAIERGFAAMAQQGAEAVIIAADAFFSGQGRVIAASATKHRIATAGIYRDHVLAGCLMAYGADIADFHRQAAGYVDKILKGAAPADLPVAQPTKITLLINRRAAAALGLEVPAELLARADEVIE